MTTDPYKILQAIVHSETKNELFGIPLKEAFTRCFENMETTRCNATAIICLLYLSHRLAGFPIEKLRMAIYNIQENCPLLEFNCSHYDKIVACTDDDKCKQVLLYDKECHIGYFPITKNDIQEMLDFYTNR